MLSTNGHLRVTKAHVIALSVGTIGFILLAAFYRLQQMDRPDHAWMNVQDAEYYELPSRITNDIPGFYVIQNACYNQKTFCASILRLGAVVGS